MHTDRYCLDCEYFQRVNHDTKGVVVLDQIQKALEIYSLDGSLVEGISCQSCDHFLWMMSFLQLYAQYHLLEYSMSIISLDSLSPSGIPIISLRTVTAVWLWWCIPNLPSHVPHHHQWAKVLHLSGRTHPARKWLCVVFLSKACWQNSWGRCLLQSSPHWPSCDWNKYPCCCVSHLLASIKSLAFVGVL